MHFTLTCAIRTVWRRVHRFPKPQNLTKHGGFGTFAPMAAFVLEQYMAAFVLKQKMEDSPMRRGSK